jgi:hypothetical protein
MRRLDTFTSAKIVERILSDRELLPNFRYSERAEGPSISVRGPWRRIAERFR